MSMWQITLTPIHECVYHCKVRALPQIYKQTLTWPPDPPDFLGLGGTRGATFFPPPGEYCCGEELPEPRWRRPKSLVTLLYALLLYMVNMCGFYALTQHLLIVFSFWAERFHECPPSTPCLDCQYYGQGDCLALTWQVPCLCLMRTNGAVPSFPVTERKDKHNYNFLLSSPYQPVRQW